MAMLQLTTLFAVAVTTTLAICLSAVPIPRLYKPPHAELIVHPRLRNIRSLDFSNITELYVKVLEVDQSMVWLLSAMVSIVANCIGIAISLPYRGYM